ncbi:MAG TPA: cyclic nucleotide-binding and patatin-like phospholipase domain-containing protein [Vicinamibacterales bacterium]|nr:cyclic nucleotide-binding and patatin-like phospholipase domain-containing protein [Vicinamibacterales bacterium]
MTTAAVLDRLDLPAALRASEAFADLADGELCDLADRMSPVTLADGEAVIRQGATCEALFLVLSGALTVSTTDRHGAVHVVDEVGPGDLAGEMNIFLRSPAAATMRARGVVQLAALSKAAFDGFSDRWPAAALALVEALRPRLRRQRLRTVLHMSDMFGDVARSALLDLESECQMMALYGGEVLFRQGDGGDEMYIVVSGRLRVVSVASDGSETLLAELGIGETVGEMAVISGEPRSATVYASRDTQLARLTKAGVTRVLERHPQAMLLMLTDRVVSRLRVMSRGEPRRAAVRTIAVLPASPDVPLGEFCTMLSTALERLAPTLHLTSERVDSSLGRRGAAQAHDREGGGAGLLEWLAGLESVHRFVVYQADRGLSPWTERCVRQADRIVLAANAAGSEAPGEIETELLAGRRVSRTPVTLVLVHPAATSTPVGTARWLTARSIERHLHVRRDALADFERVARFISGAAVGLTLGGGFTRGLAHIGVLRALAELKIPVDAIGGASIGAIVGAQWAIGWDSSRMVHETRTGFAEAFDDMTLPFLALQRGGKVSRFVRGVFQDVQIEDLWSPYFSVSANLNRAELKVHTSGALAEAVLASARVPGVFPPMVLDGELHVDGGLIDNVPVDVMRSFSNEGIVIGVDVSPPHGLDEVADYGEDVSGWRAVWDRLKPARARRAYPPSILLVLMRAIEFGGISYRRDKAAMADLYLTPEVRHFNRIDFRRAADIAEVGYQASREKLLEWLTSATATVRARRPDLFGST